MKIIWKKTALVFLMTLALAGVDGIAQEADERQKLLEQQEQLRNRIELMKREQDFLLFQKQLYDSDSKYLLLDLGKSSGQLKYKNRVLKGFRFSTSSPAVLRRISAGALTLTKKAENPRGRPALVFGKTLVIQSKSGAARERQHGAVPHISLTKKDMASLYNAVEQGAKAYVVR